MQTIPGFSYNSNDPRYGNYLETGVPFCSTGGGWNCSGWFLKSSKVKEVQLDARSADMSKFINISLARVEDDKLMGSIAFEDKIYEFSMEVSLSNKIFAHFQKEQDQRSADWLDYYQTAIYAYKHKINLEESYAIAQKALEAEQNEHTIELSLLYLEALGRSEEAQEFSALHEK